MPNGKVTNINDDFKNKITREETSELTNFLNSSIKIFSDSSLENHNIDIRISNFLLDHIAKSYLLDIVKYKEFHDYQGDKDINKYKTATYLVKWIIKIRPMFVLNPGESTEDKNISILINELYAFELACIKCDIDTKIIPKNTKDRIIYNLHYRDYNVGLFNLLLENL